MSDINEPIPELPPDQRAIRAKCFHPAGSFTEFKREEIEQSIPGRFEQIVAKYPDRIAVRGKSVTFTYDALNKLANRVARAILNRCGKGAQPIALLFEQDAPVIAAILGVLKAGEIYVPLDPSYPPARIAWMLEDSQAAFVVTNDRQRALAKVVAQNSRQLFDLDTLDPNLSEENLGVSLPPETLYGIFYTSGSTGEPKGVVENHRNMLYHIMAYTNAIHISVDDRLTLLHSLSFRAAEMHLFGALLNGATLFPLDLQEGIANLAAWLNHEGITIYHSIPMIFRQFAHTLTGNTAVPTLRLIHLSGAATSRREVDLYKQHFGSSAFSLIEWASPKATPSGGASLTTRATLPVTMSQSATPLRRRTSRYSMRLVMKSDREMSGKSSSRVLISSQAIGDSPTSHKEHSCLTRPAEAHGSIALEISAACGPTAVSSTWDAKTFKRKSAATGSRSLRSSPHCSTMSRSRRPL